MDGDTLVVNSDDGFSLVALRTDAPATVAPGRVVVCPLGPVKRRDGGEFIVDFDSVRSIQNSMAEQGVDLVIDYDHQTLGGRHRSPNGLAPAAGWINSLYADPQLGLVGTVEWTSEGGQRVANREYRYLSPVVTVREGRAVQVHSVALTNTPAIADARPIVNSMGHGGGHFACDSSQESIVNSAGREWDENPSVQRLTDRDSYCKDAIREHQKLLARGQARSVNTYHVPSNVRDRAAIINSAAREWDETPGLKKWTSREALINLALHDAGLPKLNSADRLRANRSAAEMTTIVNSAREYDQHPSLQRITSKIAYVNNALRDQGAELLGTFNPETGVYSPPSQGEDKLRRSPVRKKFIESVIQMWFADPGLEAIVSLADFVKNTVAEDLWGSSGYGLEPDEISALNEMQRQGHAGSFGDDGQDRVGLSNGSGGRRNTSDHVFKNPWGYNLGNLP